MTGLGARLKEARMAKGYTLDDLQSITKIQKRYLSGIEDENYSMMPGSFYIRAFIKQYAEAVGLDSDEMLALYKEEAKDEIEEEPQVIAPAIQRSKLKGNSQLKEIMPKLVVALFIIAIVVIMYVLFREKAANSPAEPNEPEQNVPIVDQPNETEKPTEGTSSEPETSEEAVEEDEPEEEEQPEQTLTLASTVGETSTYDLTDAESLKLVIRTSGDSWISVRDQAGVERMPQPEGGRIMKAGEMVELDVSDASSVRIRVGRTNSTDLLINDQQFEYPNDRLTQNVIIQKK